MKHLTRRLPIVMAVALGTGMLCCLAFMGNMFDSMNLYSSDILFRTSAGYETTDSSDKIVIVGIDDKSLQELGRISLWPRAYYARLVDTLSQAKARVVVFDVLFSEASPDDGSLAASMKAAGNVILPVAAKSAVNSTALGMSDNSAYLRPVTALAENSFALGHADVLAGRDATVRELSLILKDNNDDIPALSLAAVTTYLRRPDISEHSGSEGIMHIAGRSIPVTNSHDMIINYISGSNGTGATPFRTVAFADVIKGNIDLKTFEDKIVLVGATASGLGDAFWTPLGVKLNGVEIHACAVHTILTNRFIQAASPTVTVSSILVLSLLCGLAVVCFSPLPAVILSLLLSLAYVMGVSAFFEGGLMLNPFYPLLGVLCTFVSMSLYNVTWERARRNEVEKTFGRYVSPAISRRILKVLDSGEIKLDGKEQEITVAFADIRGFTDMALSTGTPELVKALNKYLAVIIQAVLKHQGIINKFSGDGVMAIWNAPTACDQHPLQAIKAAWEAQEGIKELRRNEPSLLEMNFGIGISSGISVCGNLGYEDRLEYSAIGTAVNSASRITSAAPGGAVLISEDTLKLVGDGVEVKSLGEMTIKRDSQPFKLYEVMKVHDNSDCEKRKVTVADVLRSSLTGVTGRLRRKIRSLFQAFPGRIESAGGAKGWK